MEQSQREQLIKVPAVTIGFWTIKIFATTLGETGGDAVSMSMNFGYLIGSAFFMAIFLLAVSFQIRTRTFHPVLYWVTIIASTTVGTTLADFATRSLGIGYGGGSTFLLLLLALCLYSWYRVQGTISVTSISNAKSESFYWLTIMFSQTLGTALGDWTADTAGLGYLGAAQVFGALLLAILIFHLFTQISKTALFWAAFVLTRPLGAVIGDFLDKPLAMGGLELSRYLASFVLCAVIVILIFVVPQKPAKSVH